MRYFLPWMSEAQQTPFLTARCCRESACVACILCVAVVCVGKLCCSGVVLGWGAWGVGLCLLGCCSVCWVMKQQLENHDGLLSGGASQPYRAETPLVSLADSSPAAPSMYPTLHHAWFTSHMRFWLTLAYCAAFLLL
jgi:hypothetical protein